jgi:hypothetical protein
MKSPERESGGMVAQTAAPHEAPVAKPKADVDGVSVNAEQIVRWLDMAIQMCRMAHRDPVEFGRLGLWLQQMKRAIK